ncbi:MAG: hypothetical protein KatS3mg102_0751 [Planctomycetota bacterium]|nr:MAG: hypothetical protein KatS3mg102_0751 [Planctomycetota bacterium]
MRLRSTLPAALVLLALAAGSASGYRFFFADRLAESLEQHVGSRVKVVDELVEIWDYQDVQGYLRFDTRRFRCAVPNHRTEDIALLREIARRRAEGAVEPPLIAIYGTVSREPLWGRVAAGEGAGVASETIVLLADRIERPRRRFFLEGY